MVVKSGTNKLTALRLKAAMSLKDVALATGVFTSTVSRWESGISEPGRAHRGPLMQCLGVTPEQLGAIIYALAEGEGQ